MSKTHRKCGFCQSVMPIKETECPFCGKSLENYGTIGRQIDKLLPDDRPITKLLTGLAVAVYLLVGLIAGGTAVLSPSTYTLIHFGASFPPYIVEGQIWRLVTALFMHSDILHIGFNIYALWLLGPLIEKSFGKGRYLIIFLVTGLVSTAVSMGWGFLVVETGLSFLPGASFAVPTVGMSGALTGLIGVGVTTGHRVQNEQGKQIRNVMLRWMLFIIVYGILVPQIDNAAHIGGFLAGLVLGMVLPLKDSASLRAGYFYASAATLCVAVILGSLAAQWINIDRQYPPDSMLYPTGIFGQTLREGNPSDRDWTSAARTCEDTIDKLGKQDPALDREKETKTAVRSCDEFTYLTPTAPHGYLYSAAAHAYAGDNALACKRLSTALIFVKFGLPNDIALPFQLRAESVRKIAKCP